MADEAQVRSSLQIRKGNMEYRSEPTVFNADVSGTKGPVPGAISVSVVGVDVDFLELTTPALCRLMNIDSTNFVTYGIWDPEGNTFFPLGEILPGETYVLRLSRGLHQELGTGSGTIGPDTNRLRFRANTAACNVVIEAFEA